MKITCSEHLGIKHNLLWQHISATKPLLKLPGYAGYLCHTAPWPLKVITNWHLTSFLLLLSCFKPFLSLHKPTIALSSQPIRAGLLRGCWAIVNWPGPGSCALYGATSHQVLPSESLVSWARRPSNFCRLNFLCLQCEQRQHCPVPHLLAAWLTEQAT